MARILVIDDDPDIRGLLTTFFKDQGHQVFVAEDGAHGVGMAVQCRPDVVILDVDMPVLDGHATIRVFKCDPNMADIPVVVLTADDTKETRASMRRAGCADFLSKPFDLNLLNQAVMQNLKVEHV